MTKSDEFKMLYDRGIELHKVGDHSKSITCLEEALKLKPKDGRALYNLANVLADDGNCLEALKRYEEASIEASNIPSLWYNKGNAHLDLRGFDEAIQSYNRAIELKTNYFEAWYNKGIALTELNRLDQAIESYKKSLAINSDLHQANYNLACLYSRLSKIDLSLKFLEIAIHGSNNGEIIELAKEEQDFESIKHLREFQVIMNNDLK